MALSRNPNPAFTQMETLIGVMENFDGALSSGEAPFMKRLIEITGLDRSNTANQIRGQRRARLEDCKAMLDAANQILGTSYGLEDLFPELIGFRPDPAHQHRVVELTGIAYTPIRPRGVRFLEIAADGIVRYTYTNHTRPSANVGFVLPGTPIRLAIDVAPTATFWGKGSRLQYCWIP
jgi:hypothetical protein